MGKVVFAAENGANGRELWIAEADGSGARLLADINPGTVGSNPDGFTLVNGKVVFLATSADGGRELWVADYQNAPVRLFDAYPGTGSSNPVIMKAVGGKLFFTANTPDLGRELFVTDGTASGTHLVKEIRPGNAAAAGITYVATVGDHVVFLATDGVSGREMWASDGTAAGTTLLADINPGAGGVTTSFDQNTQTSYVQTREVDGKLQFLVGVNGGNFRWWETDGTAAGTHQVPALDLGGVTFRAAETTIGSKTYFIGNDGSGYAIWVSNPDGSSPVRLTATQANSFNNPNFTAAGGKVVFLGKDAVHGEEIWVTDGTPGGTGLLKEIVPDFYSTQILEIESYGSQALFGARLADQNWGIWITDGTGGGTTLLKTLGNFGGSPFVPLGQIDGKFLFRVISDQGDGRTEQLWATNGTAGGTVQLSSYVQTYSFPYRNDLPSDFMKFGEKYVYIAGSATFGRELWVTDGTAAGTRMIMDSVPGARDGEYSNFRVVGATLFFSATTDATGVELWQTDGTAAGTHIVTDANPDPDLSPGTDIGYRFEEINGGAIFEITTVAGAIERWFSDGTVAGTVRILAGATDGYDGLQVDGKYYLQVTTPGHGMELWVSDGTVAGTHIVKEIGAGAVSGLTPASLILPFGDQVVFGTRVGTAQLWISDGTESGTVKLLDTAGTAVAVRAFEDRIFIRVTNNGAYELWTSDGTTAGAVNLGAVGGSNVPQQFDNIVQVGDAWVFAAGSGGSAVLKITDGTLAGTQTLVAAYSNARDLAVVGDKLFFVANNGDTAGDLWVTDGTSAGTVQLLDAYRDLATTRILGVERAHTGFGDLDYGHAQTLNGRLLFLQEVTGMSGSQQLFSSDGTVAGTVALNFSGAFENVYHFHDGRLFFSSRTSMGNTYDLWSTDGTPDGTVRLVQDRLVWTPSYDAPATLDGDMLYITRLEQGGMALWATDGTVAGSRQIAALGSAIASQMISLGNRVIFTGAQVGDDYELWVADANGATMIEVRPGVTGSYPHDFTLFQGLVYFIADVGDHYELWRTDGTAAGTVQAANLSLGDAYSEPELEVVSGRLTFLASDGVNGFELYAFDGTTAERLTNAVAAGDSNPGPVFEIPTPPPPPTINGNARSEIINGTAVGEIINALGGNDVVNGLAGDDTLNGGDGADQLFGGAGIDTLVGGAGNDTLDGGEGADILRGGVGSDVYKVGAGDTIEELAGEGTDTVEASVSFTLSDNVENLKLVTTKNIDGFGNDLNNQIAGNNYNNRLEGGGGVDTLDGFNGDDIILGGAGGDIIQAGNGADVITGGTGNDTLRGGSGADRFVVLQESMGVSETDTIRDFYTSQGDVMDLSGIDANALLEGDQAFTLVSTFSKQAGQMTLTWVPGQATTLLKLDVNGDGKLDYQLKINGNVTADSGTWTL
ncbi:M10 family metallopeptidase C-terminal domain-containing protein [Caulobacter sp. NIBR1757]|uniref:M10 family metallopeptidase C-terminal domain-containing protein n=1 Tax=Caulobacter sp. NIBR1757 TaxID=3016000 RepID=UPI0022F04AE6|nr:M10 family metallopeptidase C-terminal domain-containing protein [Caulobacter sp. NIBR1757]WGM39017.1 hypothetical protein AMEJIAPC_01927 [Caulobacter sp. NIBR1757]